VEYPSPKDGALLNTAIVAIATIVTSLYLPSIATAAPVPVVRVMVEREKKSITIHGFDLIVREAETSRDLAQAEQRSSLELRCGLGSTIEATIQSSKVKGKQSKKFSGPLHVTSLGGFIRVGTTSQYRDDLYVYSFNGDCVVINHVDLEKYVAGLLNSEMSASWGITTLMAQAVAARTYAIYQMKESSGSKYQGLKPPFDLDSTVRDQVYEGAHQERYRALKAVAQTRGQILTFNGKAIKAFYHSTCGGRTETAERVWGARYPYIKAVTCGFCDTSPRFNWVHSIPVEEIEARLRRERLLHGELESIRVVQRNTLGRAGKVEIRGSEGIVTVAATRLRDIVGTIHLRSTDFNVARNDSKIVFMGHGSGHGVGMCQWGAKKMGEKGRTYAQILKHYYPLADLTRLY
jgi:stage II sporulation protein D